MSLPPRIPLSSPEHQVACTIKDGKINICCPEGGGAAALGDFDRAVDYFSVIGLGSVGPLEAKDPPSPENIRDAWENAITDVLIVRPKKGEQCPPGFEIIHTTSGKFKPNLNYGSIQKCMFLAVQRQYSSKRSDYVSDIRVVYTPQESLPIETGWEFVKTISLGSNTVQQGCIHEGVMLAIRRVNYDPIDGPHPITSFFLVYPKKGERAPKEYRIIERNINKGKFGGTVHLAFRVGRPISICCLRYQPSILDRFPKTDHPSSKFPELQLPKFVFPNGITLERRSQNNASKPKYFSCVFTNIDGRRTYAACLTFHEPVPTSAVRLLLKEFRLQRISNIKSQRVQSEPPRQTSSPKRRSRDAISRDNDQCIFAPKTICVISRFPIYSVLRTFLRQLYAICLSGSEIPVERYISSFVSCIPMPVSGGRTFRVYLSPIEDNPQYSPVAHSRLKPLELHSPPHKWLPPMDIDFSALFRCLSISRALSVFGLVLQEAKILFVSSRAELLTQVMEALRSLIFPLEWQSVYITNLPRDLKVLFEYPGGGFMYGMNLSKEELSAGTEAIVNELELGGVANAVNLDTGEVLFSNGEWCYPDNESWELDCDERKKHLVENSQFGIPMGAGLVDSPNEYSDDPEFDDMGSCRSRKFYSPPKSKSTWSLRRNKAKSSSMISSSSTELSEEESNLKNLPSPLYENLRSKLKTELYEKIGLRLGSQTDLDQYESAFEFAPLPHMSDEQNTDRRYLRIKISKKMRGYGAAVVAASDTPGSQSSYRSYPVSENAQAFSRKSSFHLSRKSAFSSNATLGHESRHGKNGLKSPQIFPEDDDVNEKIEEVSVTDYDECLRGEYEGRHNQILRDIFLCAMSELLGGIHSFVRLSEVKKLMAKRGGNQPKGKEKGTQLEPLFNMSDFLATVAPSMQPFLERITKTQMFWVLVPQLALESSENVRNDQLVFFEECVTVFKNRKAGAVRMYGDYYDVSSTVDESKDESRMLLDEVKLSRTNIYPESDEESRICSSVESPISDLIFKQKLQFSEDNFADTSLHRPASMRLSATLSKIDSELLLSDATVPILIIPGPSKIGLPPHQGGKIYMYDSWPTPLDTKLLFTPPEALPPVVLTLQTYSLAHRELYGRRQHGRGAPLGTTLMYGDIEPMVVIPLEVFEAYGEIPRNYDAHMRNLLVTYASLKPHRQSCLVFYICHRWLRPCGGLNGSAPHPDSNSNIKHALICDGIKRLIESLLLKNLKVYLWLDYTCIDQDDSRKRSSGIQSLPSYIERCDALFIPYTSEALVEENPIGAYDNEGHQAKYHRSNRIFTRGVLGLRSKLSNSPSKVHYSDIVSEMIEREDQCEVVSTSLFGPGLDKTWGDVSSSLKSFSNRAWCRCEMFMATSVPFPPDGFSYFEVTNVTHRVGERPIFIYGAEQRIKGAGPTVLPRVDKAWFDSANPEEGALTNESDRRGICALVSLIRCSTRPSPKPGYSGQRRLWQRHGKGKMVFPDGSIYEGDWKGGQVHGYGVMEYRGGSKYSGDWRRGQKWGNGVMVYPDGASYDGQWQVSVHATNSHVQSRNVSSIEVEAAANPNQREDEFSYDGRRQGHGRYVLTNGAVYEGQWENNTMHGDGTYISANGSKYVGEYYRGKREGHGIVRFADGRVYDGMWKANERHGRAIYTFGDGSRFEGTFSKGLRHGEGLFWSPSGTRKIQEWKEGKLIREEVVAHPSTLMDNVRTPESLTSRGEKLDADAAAG